MKLKIETEDDILLFASTEYFQEFSYISYDKNIDIKQNNNILNIKFNTTNYNSKLEYNVALINEDDSIKPMSIQKYFLENNLICKKTIYSSGIEPIEASFSLGDNFAFDKNYTIVAYGKENYGEISNYFYLDPKTILITDPNIISMEENEDTSMIINNSFVTNIFENSETIINEINNTYLIGEVDSNITDSKEKDKGDKISSLVIVSIVLGVAVIIGGIIVGLIYYHKKRKNNTLESQNQKLEI